MYEIWAGDLLIHSDITPLDTVKVINPHLVLEDSAAGSLEFTMPPINVGYSQDKVKRMVTDITVKEDGEWLWSGRILQDDFDFWNNRKIMCEGELAFLNDSIQPPHKYDVATEHTTIESFLNALITIHNSQVAENRRFYLGTVSVVDGDITDNSNSIYRFTNYETTLACINDKLVERLKGHIRVRHAEGKRFIDYIRDEELTSSSQVVRFGVNLLDFSKNIDMSELSTAIVPRGARLDIDETDPRYIEGLEAYLTVESLDVKTETFTNPDGSTRTETWHKDKSLFVENETAVSNFGWVCTVVDWDSVTDANTLYSKAAKYLKDEQYEKMTLEINALDLKYLSSDNSPIRFQTKLRCISEPHGMDHTFIVSRMDIDLSNPGNSIYTLGTDVKLSLTQAASRVNTEVQAKIDKMPSKHEILRAAQNNAYQMIMGTENSYVHFISSKDENGKDNGISRIEITDGPTYAGDPDDEHPTHDPFPNSLHRWIWTVGGLGHIGRDTFQESWSGFDYDDNTFPGTPQEPNLNVAMTMDGAIVADKITVGKLKAYNQDGDSVYILDTETGYVQMEWAKLGPWYLNFNGNGLTDGGNAWVQPYLIACGHHGGTLIRMYGKHEPDHDGYLSVEVNEDSDYCHVHYDYITKKDAHGNRANVEWDSGSDERLKKDINELSASEAMELIKKIKPLTFRYKEGDQTINYGFTAQRIEKDCEELGIDNPFVKEFNGHDSEIKTLKYTQFIAPIVKVIQEQQKEIDELKSILQNQ